ncbi:MAG: thiolase family protein [Gammaproteobacteria bacterium]
MVGTVILGARRTPVGGMNGDLADVPAPQLAAVAIRAALEDANTEASAVDEVIIGCVLPAGIGQAPARQAALAAGLPNAAPCTTINKMCGSGLKAIMQADDAIRAGRIRCAVAGGMENMSRAPHLFAARRGLRLGDGMMLDHLLHDGLRDAFEGELMGVYAQRTADSCGFSRGEMDDFAVESLRRAKACRHDDIAPVNVGGKKPATITQDELPQKADISRIPQMRPAFAKDGTITAANSSAISDGAAALILSADDGGGSDNILAHIRAQATFAAKPAEFTLAPIGALRAVLQKAKWRADEVDLFEINEAFAVVTMAAMREFSLPHARVNVCGGACAIGHPVGASGARVVSTLLNALRAAGKYRGVAALCIGGGEAVAVAIERPH